MNQEILQNNRKLLEALAGNIAQNAVVPYIGAGLSKPPFPTWREYLLQLPEKGDRKAAEMLGHLLDEQGDFEGAAEYLLARCGVDFYDKTMELFSSERIPGEPLSDALRALPLLFRGPVITTNLDRMLETVYSRENQELSVGLAADAGFVNEWMVKGKPCLWKIHGDIDKSDSWVLTAQQYEALYGRESGGAENRFFSLLLGFLEHKSLLFLGCSLHSDKIIDLLSALYCKNPHIRHYAILELPEDGELDYDRLSCLRNMGIRTIWYPHGAHGQVGEFLCGLAERLGRQSEQSFIPQQFQNNGDGYIDDVPKKNS